MQVRRVTRIVLPAHLDVAEQRLLASYLRVPRTLARTEWPRALVAFDKLHSGRVYMGRARLTFEQYYRRRIDDVHATPFLEKVLDNTDTGRGRIEWTQRWQQIRRELAADGIEGDTVEVRLLLAYCVYWWESFARGYVREVEVVRDLRRSGVAVATHDLRDPKARRSGHDVTVLGRRGDIKTSTYFLHTARAFPPRCDFYIVRLWDDRSRHWLDLVVMKWDTWRSLDGEPTPGSWAMVADILPEAVQVDARGEALVVISYAQWKERVLARQREEEAHK